MEKIYLIIGSSAAGLSAATTLARIAPQARIICISDEVQQPYNKCFLVDYVSGERPYEQLMTLSAQLAQHPYFTLLLGTRVTVINPTNKSVTLHDGRSLEYDALFMSMGGSPYKPALRGSDAYAGVFTFYTLADVEQIVAYAQARSVRNVVVIGAGLSGLECGDALQTRGLQVTFIERGNRVLPHHTDARGSEQVQAAAQSLGVVFYKSRMAQEIVGQQGHVTGVMLDDGTVVATDMVIFTVGMRPNVDLATAAGIELHGRHVKVDSGLRTSCADIYAGGDLVAAPCSVTGALVPSSTWPDAVLQGSVAAHTMVGIARAYPGVIGHTVSNFFGLAIAACGPLRNDDSRERIVIDRAHEYRVLELENGIVKAFSLIGNTTSIVSICRRALLTQQPLSESDKALL